MNNNDLRKVMIFHLDNFNTTDANVDDSTIHKDVLKENDGFGPSNSKNIYKLAVMMTLKKQKVPGKAWPATWMDLSVADLADILLP